MLDLTCGSIRNGRGVVCSFNVSTGASSGQGQARDVILSLLLLMSLKAPRASIPKSRFSNLDGL